MSSEEECTTSSASLRSSPSFDADRLLWLCRARQMDSERDQLQRVERWKKLADTAAAASKRGLVMAMKEDTGAFPTSLLDTSLESDVSLSSSSSTTANEQQESVAAVLEDKLCSENRTRRSSSLSEARPETLEALRSLACKYKREARSSTSISLYHVKAYLERTNSSCSRPPFLKRASSAATSMAGSLDDSSLEEAQQDDENDVPVLKLECFMQCQQLGSFMERTHRSFSGPSLVGAVKDLSQNRRRIELYPWNDLEEKKFPYRAVLGALVMLLAAGIIVVSTHQHRISTCALPGEESSNQVLATAVMNSTDEKVGTILAQSAKVEVVPSIEDSSSTLLSNASSIEKEWSTYNLPRDSSIIQTNTSMRLGHQNKLLEDLEQCNEGQLLSSNCYDDENDSKLFTIEGLMAESVATQKQQRSNHRWRAFRNDAISEVARFVADHRRNKRRAPSKKMQRNRYPRRINLKQWFGKIVANNIDESWAS